METEYLKQMAERLSNLTVLECYQIVKIMKDKYGIEPETNIAPIPHMEIVGNSEQTVFDLILKSAGQNKLKVIKSVKELTGLGLIESKTLVDNAPVKLKENISKDEVTFLQNTLEELGAEIEVL